MKLNNRGFSLVEIMIAAAMLGAISMGVMSLMKNMKKGEVASETKMEELEIRRLITTLLTDQQACKKTFSGINIGSSVNNIKNGAGNIVYQKETPYGNNTLKITDMITKDTGTINSDLTRVVHFDVTVLSLKQMSGGNSKSFSIQLNVAAPGPTGTIAGCSVDNNQIISAANLASCASLNGSWNATTSKCTLNDYVKLVGDTMTGPLTAPTFVGSLTGNVTGDLTGNLIGNVNGKLCTGATCKTIADFALSSQSCALGSIQIGVKTDGTPKCIPFSCQSNLLVAGLDAFGNVTCLPYQTKTCNTNEFVSSVAANGTVTCLPLPNTATAACSSTVGKAINSISSGTATCVDIPIQYWTPMVGGISYPNWVNVGSLIASGSITSGATISALGDVRANGNLYAKVKGATAGRSANGYAMINPDGRIGPWDVGNGYIEVILDNNPYGISIWLSDKKHKTNIQNSNYNATADIQKMSFKSFHHNLDKSDWKVGLIAQELEQIDKNYVDKLSDGTLMPNIGRLISLSLKSIQDIKNEKDKEIHELKIQIDQLKKENEKYNARLERLEKMITTSSKPKPRN